MRPKVLFVAGLGSFLRSFVAPLAQVMREEGFVTVAAAGSMVALDGFDRLYTLPNFRREGPVGISGALRALIAIARYEKPTLMHLHTPPAVVLGRIAGRVVGIPTVAVIHTTFLEPRGVRSAVFGGVEGALARLSAATVVMNRDDRAFYRRYSAGSPVHLAPVGGIGINVRQLQMAAQQSERVLGPWPVILVLGRLTKEKNLDVIVEAFETVRRRKLSASLWFVGSPHRGDGAWRVPNRPGVHQLNWQANPYPLLAASDVLVSASRREGFGLGVAEALALGVPAVAVASRGVREINRQAPEILKLVPPTSAGVAFGILRALDVERPHGLRASLASRWSQEDAISFHLRVVRRVCAENAHA